MCDFSIPKSTLRLWGKYARTNKNVKRYYKCCDRWKTRIFIVAVVYCFVYLKSQSIALENTIFSLDCKRRYTRHRRISKRSYPVDLTVDEQGQIWRWNFSLERIKQTRHDRCWSRNKTILIQKNRNDVASGQISLTSNFSSVLFDILEIKSWKNIDFNSRKRVLSDESLSQRFSRFTQLYLWFAFVRVRLNNLPSVIVDDWRYRCSSIDSDVRLELTYRNVNR